MDEQPGSPADVAKRLRVARENAGLSQSQIAKIMNLHRPTVSEIEAGRRRVSASEVALFASHYGVDIDWVLGMGTGATNMHIDLVARELAKLDPADVSRLMELIKTFKTK